MDVAAGSFTFTCLSFRGGPFLAAWPERGRRRLDGGAIFNIRRVAYPDPTSAGLRQARSCSDAAPPVRLPEAGLQARGKDSAPASGNAMRGQTQSAASPENSEVHVLRARVM